MVFFIPHFVARTHRSWRFSTSHFQIQANTDFTGKQNELHCHQGCQIVSHNSLILEISFSFDVMELHPIQDAFPPSIQCSRDRLQICCKRHQDGVTTEDEQMKECILTISEKKTISLRFFIKPFFIKWHLGGTNQKCVMELFKSVVNLEGF